MFRISNCSIFPVGNPSNRVTQISTQLRFADLYSLDTSVTKSGVQDSGVVRSFSPSTMVGKIGKQLVFYPSSHWKVEVTRLMRLIAISDRRKLGPIYQL